jgi:hypothetical protein
MDQQYQVLQITSGISNIIVNGGFEIGNGSSASNWSISGSQLPVLVSTNSHSGQYSMSLAVTNPASSPNNSEIDQNVGNEGGSAVIPGLTYNFSFWAWQASSGVSLVQNYIVRWLNSSGSDIGDTGFISFSGGSGSWTQISDNNLVAPTNAVNASLTIYATTGAVAHGYGNVLIDDVSLGSAAPGQTNVLSAIVQPGVQLSWPSTSGELYDVQWSGNVSSSNWSNLASSLTGNGNTNIVFDVFGTNQSRFYQVVQNP